MLMPAVAAETGPFKGCRSGWVGAEPGVGTGARGAAVALYLALVSAACLSNIGHDGPIIVEGPFAGNLLYLEMLSVAVGSDVFRASGTTGTSSGAAMLVGNVNTALRVDDSLVSVSDNSSASLHDYANRWRRTVQQRSK